MNSEHKMGCCIFLSLLFMVIGFTEAQSRHLLTAPDTDKVKLSSLNATRYLVQFCNSYCHNNEKKKFDPFDFVTAPKCLECKCDEECRYYGDCCPDADGNVVSDPFPPMCLYSESDLDIQSKVGYGIFMVTKCQGQEVKDKVFSPVSSESKNMSFFNSEVADCNNVTDYMPWSLELDCTSGESSGDGDGDANGLDLIDHLYDNEEDCQHVYAASPRTNPRICDPILASSSRVRECNVTDMWSEFDQEIATACEQHDYPVYYEEVVYANIFCALCNGVVPLRTPYLSVTTAKLPPPITVITQFFRPRKDPSPTVKKCKTKEWRDPVKQSCHPIYCSPGRRYEEGECVVEDYDVIGDEYTFNVILKPENNENDVINHWNSVQQMFVENFKRFMSAFRVSNYKFSIGLIEDMNSIQSSVYDFQKAVLVNCNFIVTNPSNRTHLENQVYNFATGIWIINYDGKAYNFTAMISNVPLAKVKLKAYYWAYPVSGDCCLPVAAKFDLKKTNTETSSRLIHVTNELFCPHVKLPKTEYETEASGWITLNGINVSISSSDFSFDMKKKVRICLDLLKEIYNGSYKGEEKYNHVPSTVLAQQILSLVCVTLSLLCLSLTLITYFTFPALRSLPAKNNMFLMGTLFVAQLLFQFGIDKTDHQIICIIIGVFIHFCWLCVIFWMNVCSYHMLRVFGVHSALPQSRTKHWKTLLRYCLYSFGSSAFVVMVSVSANLIKSRGIETGYGGVVCYLASNTLVGLSFVLPLSIILTMNVTFFAVTVRAISKIENLKKHGMKERDNVYVYLKLSSLTGMFWIVAILAEVFHEEILVYISIILNGSLGVLLFVCYTANRRVFDLWKGLFDGLRKRSHEESQNGTVSTSA